MRINPFPQKTLWAAAVAAAMLSAAAFADTIILKSGEKIDGTILEETATAVTVEYKAGAGITDTRTVQKAEIDKVEKVTPDAVEFQTLKGMQPGANSMPAPSYQPIVNRLQGFVAQFPQSPHAAAVQAQLAAFEEEKKRVEAGEVKLNNGWLSKEQAQQERYQINGQVILNYMQDQLRRGDVVGAMNSFGQLEANYKGARVFPDAVELMKTTLPRLKASADQTLRNWLTAKAAREKGLELVREPEKSQMIAANEREEKQAEVAIENASRMGMRYPPMIGTSEKALTEISARANEDAQRLAQIPTAPMRQSIQLADKAREQIAKGEFEAAEATLSQASSAWSENELVARLQTESSNKRTAANTPPAPAEEQPAATAEAEAAAAAAANPAPPTVEQGSGTEQAAPAEEDEEPAKSFFATPLGLILILAGLIAALAGWNAYKKARARADENAG